MFCYFCGVRRTFVLRQHPLTGKMLYQCTVCKTYTATPGSLPDNPETNEPEAELNMYCPVCRTLRSFYWSSNRFGASGSPASGAWICVVCRNPRSFMGRPIAGDGTMTLDDQANAIDPDLVREQRQSVMKGLSVAGMIKKLIGG